MTLVTGTVPTVPVVSRADAATPQFRSEYILAGRPVIVTDLLREVTGLDHVVRRVGPGLRLVRIYGEERVTSPRDLWDRYCDFVSIETTEYVKWLKNGEAKKKHAYLAQVDLTGTQLDDDVEGSVGDVFRSLFPSQASGLNLWLGPGGHREPLHFDPADGMLVQLIGTKRVRLVSPRLSRALYPFSLFSKIRPWFSRVSLAEPDLVSFPRMGEALATMIEVDLQAGQGLYIPAGWWHEVESIGNSLTCSVNKFFVVRPKRRLLSVRWGLPLYAAMLNKRLVLAIERLFRRPDRAQT
jgi:lysine-specific demethylase 8/hypoxia-inducible factor 1-alpha inhibitor (HIF hydroxylase)